MLWTDPVPTREEMDDAATAYEQHESISSVIFEMLVANVVTLLPPGEKSITASRLGVVPEPITWKLGSR